MFGVPYPVFTRAPLVPKAEHQQSISRLPTKCARVNTGYGTPNMFYFDLFPDILPRRWSSVVSCFRVHCVHFVLLTTVHKCVCKAQITYPLQVIGWPTSLKRYFVMKAWAVFMRLRFLFEVIIRQFGSLINENRIFAMRSSLVAQSSSIGSTPSFS